MKPPRPSLCLLLLLLATTARGAEPDSLRRDLDALLTGGPLAGGDVGAVVIRAAGGQPLYSRGSRRPLLPASNMKILTAVAALGILGPQERLATELHASAPPGAAGDIAGPVWIRGGGDPSLVGEAWWLLAREMKLKGILRIAGGLVADTSLFDGQNRPPGWPGPECDQPYCAPFDALMANFSSVEVRVMPGAAVGDPARVGLFPLPGGLTVDSGARTGSGSGNDLRISILRGGDVGRVVVRGELGIESRTVRSYRRVPDAAMFALGCLRDALSREGIQVEGPLQRGATPEEAHRLLRYRSRPLYEIVSDMNKYSNNVMAESLVKVLGAGVAAPGTTESGLNRMVEHFGTLGVDMAGWSLADGSGLSRSNRVTALGIAQVLQAALGDPALRPELVGSLAVGGDVGTLSKRQTTSGRLVRAKTGKIAGALGLSGYAFPEDGGPPVIFSFLVNGPAADAPGAAEALDRASLRLLRIAADGAGTQPAAGE